MKTIKRIKYLNDKIELYESALLRIAEAKCSHDEQPGVGAVLSPPCPKCIAWCAINPRAAQPRVEAARDIMEKVRVKKDLTGVGV